MSVFEDITKREFVSFMSSFIDKSYKKKMWSNNHKQLQKESMKNKNSILNGIQTHDLCDTVAVLYQLSCQGN